MGTTLKPAKFNGSTPWTDPKTHFDACATFKVWTEKQKRQAQGVFGNLNSISNLQNIVIY